MILPLLLTLTAHAQTALPQSSLSAAIQAKATQTVFILDQPTEYCTVSPLSNDGYMLTALHCVRDCLDAAGLSQSGTQPFIGLQELYVSKRAPNTLCRDISIPALGIKGVTVVETGSSLAQFDARFVNAFPALFNELRTHGMASRANDFAILKVAPPKPLACLKLKATAAPAGSAVWALGYPLSKTPVLSASAGQVYASAQDSVAYKAATTPADQVYMTSVYSDPAVLYSNASNQFGQSGGPVITADGSIVGVVSGFTVTAAKDGTETHELVAASSASILKSVSPALAAHLVCH